jgi:hypothetical protein
MEGGVATCLQIILLKRGMGIRYPGALRLSVFPVTFLFGWKFDECIFINLLNF